MSSTSVSSPSSSEEDEIVDMKKPAAVMKKPAAKPAQPAQPAQPARPAQPPTPPPPLQEVPEGEEGGEEDPEGPVEDPCVEVDATAVATATSARATAAPATSAPATPPRNRYFTVLDAALAMFGAEAYIVCRAAVLNVFP